MALRPPLHVTPAGTALTAVSLVLLPPFAAQARDGQCQKLQQSYQQESSSAESLKSKAAQQAVQSGSNLLSSFGIQLSSSGNAQQAFQKGALAATNPQMQNAVMIQLLSANAHLPEMIGRGCKPPAG